MTEHGAILRRMPQAYSRVICPQSNIQYPRPTVLYLPVPPDRLGNLLGLIVQTGNVIAVLEGDFPIKMALGLPQAKEVELFPGLLIDQPLKVSRGPGATTFYTPRSDGRGFLVTKRNTGNPLIVGFTKELLDFTLKGALILREGEPLISLLLHKLRS